MISWFKARWFSAPGAIRSSPSPLLAVKPQSSIEATQLRDMGNTFVAAGKWGEAEACYARAIATDPTDTASLINIGFVLIERKRPMEAIPYLNRARTLNPGAFDAYYFLGRAQIEMGSPEGAIEHFTEALSVKPDFEAAAHDLCLTLLNCRRIDEARAVAEKGVVAYPGSADFFYYLGTTQNETREFNAAITNFTKALALCPDYPDVLNNLGTSRLELGDLDKAVECLQKAIAQRNNYVDAHSNLLFTLNYHPDKTAEEIYEAYRHYDACIGLPLREAWRTHGNDRNPDRRLRVGYVSPDMRNHAVRFFLEPLMARHDKRAVEVFAYAELEQEDAVTVRFRSYADRWVGTAGLSDAALAERIRNDGIDILVDLAGHTAKNRLGVFAMKPAPVSVSWLGYGYTTGLSAIDYYLTDETSAPPGSEGLFSERPWRLKTPGWVYRNAEGMGEVSELPALRRGHVTLGTLTRAVRINHRTIRVWSQILQRVPDARLVVDSKNYLDPTMCDALAAKFAAHGIGRERLELGFHSPPWDVLRGIDIGLDCFPHNSGTTLFETLYMGVPYVTLAGRPSVGRLGSSILQGVGHPEWIAQTEEDYVDKVVELANDLPRLAKLRTGLRQQMRASALMDEQGFARKVEQAYRFMFEAWAKTGRSDFVGSR